jgi:hypothetical protein
VSASLQHRLERRVLVALVLTFLAALAMLFSHTGWSVTGEGGRVLYAIAAIAALAVAIPLRTPDRRLRSVAWIVTVVLLASSFVLTQAAVERRAQAGAEVRALIAALAQTADAVPAGSYAFVIVPDHVGSIPFARNAQGGLMLPPVQPRPLSAQLIVQLADDLPAWPPQLEKNIVGRLKTESIWDVAADREASGTQLPPAVPDRFFCWNSRSRALVALPLTFRAGFADWNEAWGRALDGAGCRA